MQHCVVNTFKFLLMEQDPELRAIVHRCGLINADGQSVVWGLRFLGRPCPERVTGIDLMEQLVARAEKEKLSVYFLGATPDVLERVLVLYRQKYPTLRVAGSHHGYIAWDTFAETELADRVRAAQPDMLFVALDSPRKEYFLSRQLERMQVPFSMGVGGTFDVLAGRYPRAPRWMQNHGLEWVWRLSLDPLRMWKRYLMSHSLFLWIIAKENWRKAHSP